MDKSRQSYGWIPFLRVAALAGALSLTLAAGPTPAAADDQADKAAGFARLDKDGDGALSKSEYGARGKGDPAKTKKIEGRFKRLDADGDGKLSPGEFASGGKKDGKKKGDEDDD